MGSVCVWVTCDAIICRHKTLFSRDENPSFFFPRIKKFLPVQTRVQVWQMGGGTETASRDTKALGSFLRLTKEVCECKRVLK